MTKLSKDDIERIEKELSYPYGAVALKCDGYDVTIYVQQVKARKFDLMVYVNGWFRGEWLRDDTQERRRFYRPTRASLYKPSQRAEILKDFGKRRAARLFPDLDKTFTYYMPTWSATSSMLRHFHRENTSVSLVSIGARSSTITVDVNLEEASHV
ncbi:hypothetical protein [Paraburkholderia unamae]|uniref:Uncharacterized protein n=1 Tax=Paraburkholderia unamae TaxID=219649 RepID=A0ABX5KJK5_9BURK|nr:hypothetical protein [Paraburkholderia unamae]PVX80032.1 hypothetical protein C7402_112219 [Paraburkholderia unamae]